MNIKEGELWVAAPDSTPERAETRFLFTTSLGIVWFLFFLLENRSGTQRTVSCRFEQNGLGGMKRPTSKWEERKEEEQTTHSQPISYQPIPISKFIIYKEK